VFPREHFDLADQTIDLRSVVVLCAMLCAGVDMRRLDLVSTPRDWPDSLI
jgi:hypothetical protein